MSRIRKGLSIIFSIVLVLLLFTACEKKSTSTAWEVTVSGRVGLSGTGAITIKDWADTTSHVETVLFDETARTYSKKLTLKEPGFYRIFFFETQFVDFVLNKSDITINIDESGRFEVLGSPEMEIYTNVDAMRTAFQQSESVLKLNQAFSEAVAKNDEETIGRLQEEYQQLVEVSDDSIASYLISKSPNPAVIDLLNRNTVDKDRNFLAYEKVAEKLTGEWENYSLSRDFKLMVEKARLTAVGSKAPEIALPDPGGKVIKLSSLKGKFVLVDFWAKWCGPCRRENPNLVKAYQRFGGENFEVMGVSLDRSREDWIQAIAEDGLNWLHVSDLRYFDSEAARTYNINAIPFSILVDPNGVIVAKNLRGAALHKTLERFLKKS